MNLNNLSLVELSVKQAVVINGGHVPANDWGNFKEGLSRIAHNVGDFVRGIYSGLGKA